MYGNNKMQSKRRRRVQVRMLAAFLALPLLAGCESMAGIGLSGDDAGLFSSGVETARQKAKVSFRQNNFGLAEESFTAVLKRDPYDAEAWTGLAASYDRLGRFDLADKAYEKALAVGGRRPEILNNLGYSHLLRGDRGKAGTYFREAAALAPDNTTIRGNLALLES